MFSNVLVKYINEVKIIYTTKICAGFHLFMNYMFFQILSMNEKKDLLTNFTYYWLTKMYLEK